MKDRTARILAVIALVFMGIFSVALVMTIIDYRMLGGSIGFIALSTGVFAIVIFLALKADGRGYSITKMNNEIELQKIEEELKKQKELAQPHETADSPEDTENPDTVEQSEEQ